MSTEISAYPPPEKQPTGNRVEIQSKAIYAVAAALAGLAILFWAQRDLGGRHFSPWTLFLLLLGVAMVLAGAFATGFRSLIGIDDEPTADAQPDSLPREWHLWRLLMLGFSFIFMLMAFAMNDRNMFSPRGVIVWSMSIACFLIVWWQPSADGLRLRERYRRLRGVSTPQVLQVLLSLGLLLTVFGVAAFFRLHDLGVLPQNPGRIEADIGDSVADILRGRTRIYFPGDIGEGGVLYLTAALVKLFDLPVDYNLLKLTSVVMGLLGIGATYLLLKEAFQSRLTAYLGALFMAIAHWPVTISRNALTMSAAPLFAALTLLFLLRALKHSRTNDFLLCALSAGFGLYFYQGLRVLPFLIVACLAIKFISLLIRLRWGESFALFGRSLLLGLMMLLVFTPMARTWHDHPAYYMETMRTRIQGQNVEFNELGRFGHNLQNALWMFNWRGDSDNLQNIPLEPALGGVMGALLLAGAALALVGWLRYRRGPVPYLLLAFIAGLLPSALALALPGDNPDFGWTAAAMPLTFGVVALPVSFIVSRLSGALPPPAGWAAASLLAVGLTIPLAISNYHWYFDDYAKAYESVSAKTACMAQLIEGTKEADPAIEKVVFVGSPDWLDWRGVHFAMGRPDWLADMYPFDPGKAMKDGGKILYVLNVDDTQSRGQLEELFPLGAAVWRTDTECPAHLFVTKP